MDRNIIKQNKINTEESSILGNVLWRSKILWRLGGNTAFILRVISSEISINLYHAIRRVIPEDSIIYSHRAENLESRILWSLILI